MMIVVKLYIASAADAPTTAFPLSPDRVAAMPKKMAKTMTGRMSPLASESKGVVGMRFSRTSFKAGTVGALNPRPVPTSSRPPDSGSRLRSGRW
jgi:hypothetical protein